MLSYIGIKCISTTPKIRGMLKPTVPSKSPGIRMEPSAPAQVRKPTIKKKPNALIIQIGDDFPLFEKKKLRTVMANKRAVTKIPVPSAGRSMAGS